MLLTKIPLVAFGQALHTLSHQHLEAILPGCITSISLWASPCSNHPCWHTAFRIGFQCRLHRPTQAHKWCGGHSLDEAYRGKPHRQQRWSRDCKGVCGKKEKVNTVRDGKRMLCDRAQGRSHLFNTTGQGSPGH